MKTIIGKIFALTLLVTTVYTTNAQNLRFGVFADPQLSWFTSDTKDFSSNGLILGFDAGLALDKYFAERYAITTGLSLSNLGGNLTNKNEYSLKIRDEDVAFLLGPGSNIKYRGQYINVPFGLKFKTNQIGYTTFYAQLGIKGHLKIKGYVWETENEIDREVIDNDHLYFGFVSYMFGGGIEYSLGGPSSVQVGVLYSNGMTPVFETGRGRISLGNLGLRLGLVF